VRTSVLTFVVVIDDRDQAPTILDVVRDLGGQHPSRAVVLVLGVDESSRGVDAHAALHVAERGGHAVCFEELVLEVRGRARYHLDSVVEPFTLPDLPVAVWSPFHLPSPGDPLLAVADRVIIDSRFLPETEDFFFKVASLARRFPVTDMSWIRLAPWRTLLASLFDGVGHAFLRGVHRAEVSGNFGPRYLLGGWLAACLGLPASAVALSAERHVRVRLSATAAGREGCFAVERRGDERVVHASTDVPGLLVHEQVLQLAEQSRSTVLAEALAHMGRDLVYERALFGALDLLR
jgi:glucose-6-phosphate dehydrogenase assembly protein OpcA